MINDFKDRLPGLVEELSKAKMKPMYSDYRFKLSETDIYLKDLIKDVQRAYAENFSDPILLKLVNVIERRFRDEDLEIIQVFKAFKYQIDSWHWNNGTLALCAPFIDIEDKIFFPPSAYSPDQDLLQYLLLDHVGGGEGKSPIIFASLFCSYLKRYSAVFPEDSHAKEIYGCLHKFYILPLDIPLEEAAERLCIKLQNEGSVAFPGGYFKTDESHALFYELILEKDGTVTFKTTNSGDGLKYHPVYQSKGQRDYRYRTLIFTKATIESLKEGHFLEMLISLTRPRSVSEEFELNQTVKCSANDLYNLFFFGWPGGREVEAANPGGAQRSPSCAVQSILKWVVGQYDSSLLELLSQSWMLFWIKCAAFSDYINNAADPSSQLIEDGVRRLANQASKMQKQNLMPAKLFQSFEKIAAKAKEAGMAALECEISRRIVEKTIVIDLKGALPVEGGRKSDEKKGEPINSDYNYPHSFHTAPLNELKMLATSNIAFHLDEMGYRLNFFRFLPDFTDFNPGLVDLNDLGIALQKFFYNREEWPSIHVPDAFFGDLINAWMIIYFAAKKESMIPGKVLLEWMLGLKVLIKEYRHEYIFDSLQSKKRFGLVQETCLQEIETLLNNLDDDYTPPENYWTVWKQKWDSEEEWLPFGAILKAKGGKSISEIEQLPEMALFADELIQQLTLEGKTEFENEARQIRANFKEKDPINRAIWNFALKLPIVPFYDVLREGLLCLFVFSDRHVSRGGYFFASGDRFVRIMPAEGKISVGGYSRPWLPGMGAPFYARSSRPGVEHVSAPCYYPETHIPLTSKEYRKMQDLNLRIKELLPSKDRLLPFMTLKEEKEFIAFVQKDSITCLTEAINFFNKILPKLAHPDYQSSFEHILFSAGGIENVSGLLLEFVAKGILDLLKKGPRIQSGAAFLFNVQLRLFQMREIEKERLYATWELLIDKGLENPILGVALGESVLAAASSIEQGCSLLGEEKYRQLMAETMLLQCIPGNYNSKYIPLHLHYGYQSFMALMLRAKDPIAVWKLAAHKIFNAEEASGASWESEKGFLNLKTLSINLATHTIEGRDDFKMRLIPKKVTENYDFKNYFGKRSFLGNFRRDGLIEIYTFSWKQKNYEVHTDTSSYDFKIYREFKGVLYEKTYSPECFNESYSWKRDGKILIEDKSGVLIAVGTAEGYKRVKKGRVLNEILGKFKVSPLQQLFEGVEIAEDTIIWLDNDSQEICRIELTKLKLKFQARAQKIFCVQFPGFFIAPIQQADFLKNFAGSLILQNAAGALKVLQPVRQIDEPQDNPYRESPIVGKKFYALPYITYDISSAKEYPALLPGSKNVLAAMQLFTIYLYTRQYERALELLDETRLLSRRTIDETVKSFLTNILSDKDKKDHHPHAVALRLRLYAWAHKLGVKVNSAQLSEKIRLFTMTFIMPSADLNRRQRLQILTNTKSI